MGTILDPFSFHGEGDKISNANAQNDQDGAKMEWPKPAAQQNNILRVEREVTKKIAMLSTHSSCQSLFQEAERPPTAGKKPRAVFADLHTAHISITGSAKSRYQGLSQNAPAHNEDDSSIPLNDLSAFDDSSTNLLPVLPRPAAVSGLRRSRTSDNEILPEPKRRSRRASFLGKLSSSGASSAAQNSSRDLSSKSTFCTLKNAIASITGSASGNDYSVPKTAPRWHRGSADNIPEELSNRGEILKSSSTLLSVRSSRSASDSDLYRRFMDSRDLRPTVESNESSNYHSGLGGPPSDTLPHGLGRYIGPDGYGYHHFVRNDNSPVRDGSTVGNIYAHYLSGEDTDSLIDEEESLRSESRDKINRRASIHGFPSSPPITKSKTHSRINTPSKAPPNFSLPQRPPNRYLGVQNLAPSSSQAISHSSSYGDTGVLLDAAKELRVIPPVPPRLAANNPFIHQKEFNAVSGPQVVVSPAESSPSPPQPSHATKDHNRLPLEKEVSRALRRASGYSNFSIGSMSEAPQDRHEDPPSETSTYRAIKSLLRRNIEINPSSMTDDSRDVTGQQAASTQSFYDKHSLPSRFISTQQQTVVRVPITHLPLVSLPDSPPDSPPGDLVTPFGRRQLTSDDPNDWETVGESAIGRPLANDFLGGTIGRAGSSIANLSDEASVRELDSFNSFDRVTHHPGNNQYFGGYRQRDLKKVHIPVLLPVFGEHKVNGYLSDSTRTRPPPNPFYQTPPPLSRIHDNPFKSPAPLVSPSAKKRRHPRFPPSRGNEDGRDNNSETDTEWMNDFRDPGPVTMTEEVPRTAAFRNAIPHDGAVHQLDRSSSKSGSAIMRWRNESREDGFVEMQTFGGKVAVEKKKSRNPITKRPPGAFYFGLRTVSKSKGKGTSGLYQQDRKTRAPLRTGTVKDQPTNVLRPLSLLADRRPTTPTAQITRDPNEPFGNDFVYRSPLAPPRSKSW